MRIGGFVKLNTTDWPGEEVAEVFVKGCNFKCSYCPNHLLAYKDFLDRTVDMPQDLIIHYLKTSGANLTAVSVSGGEPTLQNDLPMFLANIKSLGLKVKLKTNGTNPAMLRRLINLKLVDFISMDVKSGFAPGQYESITGVESDPCIENVLQSIDILKTSGIPHSFFTVVLTGIHYPETLDELRNLLKGSTYILQKFKTGNTTEVLTI